jgi:hypothetical protein
MSILPVLPSSASLLKENLCHDMVPPRFDVCPLVLNFCDFWAE